jgi:hypothetical protein
MSTEGILHTLVISTAAGLETTAKLNSNENTCSGFPVYDII